jgi:hypothetical protein
LADSKNLATQGYPGYTSHATYLNSNESSEKSKKISVGAIVGIAAGGFCLICVCVGTILYVSKGRKYQDENDRVIELDQFDNTNTSNPNLDMDPNISEVGDLEKNDYNNTKNESVVDQVWTNNA